MKLLLLISAIKDELWGLEEFHLKIQKEKKIFLLDVGIGKINSILKLSDWYHNIYKRDFSEYELEILFLGSCGSYFKKYPEIIISHHFINYDIFSLQKKSKTLSENSQLIKTITGDFANLFVKLNNLDFGIVNSTDSITLTEVDTNLFLEINHEIAELKMNIYENLECYGIAKFCQFYNISFLSVLAVTNYVYSEGSKEWNLNYRNIAKKLNDLLKKYLYLL